MLQVSSRGVEGDEATKSQGKSPRCRYSNVSPRIMVCRLLARSCLSMGIPARTCNAGSQEDGHGHGHGEQGWDRGGTSQRPDDVEAEIRLWGGILHMGSTNSAGRTPLAAVLAAAAAVAIPPSAVATGLLVAACSLGHRGAEWGDQGPRLIKPPPNSTERHPTPSSLQLCNLLS
ncbi:predicted protein [Verticillium alfalfae VaMs.102]|uniref:Predicted protein n=1 Tax=Verticillium alfalfae (strain VaMs.102 / ATCC MYA-4576 / FGSC 10136) TaxID=526221 RepID=C9SLB8_VERA1|nr:predicted protein [Verticillium alfalfae VaMs.102]EEY19486.1 predicted protein [Verticillium alfalfae VaMs.102]